MKNNKKIKEKISESELNNIEIPKNAVYKQTLKHYVDEKLEHTYYFYYDKHNNMILMIKPPYKPLRYFYEYNNFGQVTVMSNDDGNRFFYEYNTNKTLSKEICYTKYELFYTAVYRHNRNNKSYKCEYITENDSKTYYEFDCKDNGTLSVKRAFNKFGLVKTEYFTYDDFGNLIKKEVSENARSIIYHEIYTYNSDNRLIQTARYDNNKLSYIDKYTYKFYK